MVFATVLFNDIESISGCLVPATTGLHLLVDSTGIKMLGEGEWKAKKHSDEYRRQWRKVYLCIHAATLEVRAMEVTDNSVGDAPVLTELLEQFPVQGEIASVSAYGTYDTEACHETIPLHQAHAVTSGEKMPSLE